MIINSQLGGKKPTGTKSITSNGIHDVADYANADVQVPGGVTGKYKLLDRVKDDTNIEIGTVCEIRKDSNNVEYAVVCLDGTYRTTTTLQVLEDSEGPLTLTKYTNITLYEAPETATANCTAILTSGASPAISECRSHSFVIDGLTYAGQLPTLPELIMILSNRTAINDKDPSSNKIVTGYGYVSSTAQANYYTWRVNYNGNVDQLATNYKSKILPVLEIPNS